MHDKHGKELFEGDHVTLECVVETANTSPDYCNLTLRTVEPMYPSDRHDAVTVNARQVEKGTRALPPVEDVAQAVHEDWCASKRAKGVASRKHATSGEELIAPWADLSEPAKQDNRDLVHTVYSAIGAVAQ